MQDHRSEIAAEARGVSKHFGGVAALSAVDFDVVWGEVHALLGENGAGKTTAIKLLLGLEEADRGTLQVLGLDSRRDGAEIRRRVGYVPERPALYEWMTAGEIGWFTAGFYADAYEHEYRSLLERFRVPTERKISHMSKGMRAKVTLSLALAHQPELLILDEPTSAVDAISEGAIFDTLRRLRANHTTLVIAHRLSTVRDASRILVLDDGRLIAQGSHDELITTCELYREMCARLSVGESLDDSGTVDELLRITS